MRVVCVNFFGVGLLLLLLLLLLLRLGRPSFFSCASFFRFFFRCLVSRRVSYYSSSFLFVFVFFICDILVVILFVVFVSLTSIGVPLHLPFCASSRSSPCAQSSSSQNGLSSPATVCSKDCEELTSGGGHTTIDDDTFDSQETSRSTKTKTTKKKTSASQRTKTKPDETPEAKPRRRRRRCRRRRRHCLHRQRTLRRRRQGRCHCAKAATVDLQRR